MIAQELKDLFRTTLVPQRTIDQEFITLDAIVDFVSQGDTTGIPDWTAPLTFQLDGSDDGTFCTESDTNGRLRFWKTKVDDNTGNQPPTDPLITENAYLIEVSPSDGSADKEWAVGLYGTGLVIVYFDTSGSGANPRLYLLKEPVRPFNSTNFTSELIAGKWGAIGFPAGSLRDMGAYNASTDLFPDTPLGSGLSGAIQRGDQFDISVAGTLGGEEVPAGATIRAKADAPGQTLGNWRIYY